MSLTLVVVIAASVIILLFLALRFFSWLKTDNLRREQLRRQALNSLVPLHFPQTGPPCRAQVIHEVQGARDAGAVAGQLELRARQAAFPTPALLSSWEGRESTVSRFIAFVTSTPFAIAAGTGEQFFYSLFDGLKDTPFADTLSYLAEYTGIQVAEGMHEAANQVAPAIHHLWDLLSIYYHDHPDQFAKLIMATVDVLRGPANEHALGLLKHAFDAGHLHIYGEAMAPVLHPIGDGIAHSLSTAHEHLGHLDIHSFDVPHDAAVPHFHFPFITLAISATREIRLLSDDKTTIGRSLANASLDVAGTSVGGLGGAKVGALIGTAFAPGIGTAIGGAIGGLLGAFGGRAATNAVKAIPLKKASEAYESRYASMESETTAGAHRLYNGTSAAMSQGQQDYLKAIGRLQPLSTAVAPLGVDVKSLADKIRGEYTLRMEHLTHAYQQALAVVPADSWYHYLFGGTGEQATKSELFKIYDAKWKQLQAGVSQIPTDAACVADPLGSLQQLASLEFPSGRDYESPFIEVSQKLKLAKAAFLSNLLVWARNSAHHYQEAMRKAQATISGETEKFKNLCDQWMKEVQAAKADVELELARLGRA